MRELVVMIWSALALITGFVLMLTIKKRPQRKLGKYVMIYKILLVLLTFIVSFLIYYFVKSPLHLIWITRFSILLLGVLNVWVLFKRPWTKRDGLAYEEDAFLLEFIFVLISGFLVSIAFVSAPQFFELIEYRVNVSRTLWEAPGVFLLPFLVVKLMDFSGQVPFKVVENPWVYPLELTNAADWPWRELMQVNFHLKKSLVDEYDMFSWASRPWIEAPKEVTLGSVFQLCIQERRKRVDLGTIQDLGDEYDGEPTFCWLFSIKRIWYNPTTWFRSQRYLNPDLSINKNEIEKGDIIVAKRIPGDGTRLAGVNYDNLYEDDSEKTVIINR